MHLKETALIGRSSPKSWFQGSQRLKMGQSRETSRTQSAAPRGGSEQPL